MNSRGREGNHLRWRRLGEEVAHSVVQETSFLKVSKELADLKLGAQESISSYWARSQEIRERCLEEEVPITTKSFLSAILQDSQRHEHP